MILLMLLGCPPAEDPAAYGSHGAIAADVRAPLGDVVPFADEEQVEVFERGKNVAMRTFALSDGLGPGFNLTACSNCHERPTVGGAAGLYRNFYLTGKITEDGAFLPVESAGTSGGVIRLYYSGTEEPARPTYDEETDVIAQRNPIPFFGVGLLAELEEAEILKCADPDDRNGDGISGRPNYDRGFVGRFGMKSQTVSIEGFIRGPLRNHLGITSDPLSNEQRALLPVDSSTPQVGWLFQIFPAAWAQAAAPDGPLTDTDAIPDPELSSSDLFDLVSFSMLTAAPPVEPLRTEGERAGQAHFDEIGCADCHLPRINGPRGPLPVYSDLLLHDMGATLADGIQQGEAEGNEFRTQPLWGVSAVGPYLHDGRAATLSAAILLHGGEAQEARDGFAALSTTEQEDLLSFLGTLGGRSQYSPGLQPPGVPLPAAGEWGGPLPGLSALELSSFENGFAAFDRDHSLAEGVGAPRFNGDSCRACHFQPVFGGAGPRDMNVMRHGLLSSAGDFIIPLVGTILHRETALAGSANVPQLEASIFEARQTPHLFGLGLIEAIPEAALVAQADPEDSDGDGISGRLSRVDGDRIGRFGWKAQVPDIAEFVRDAVGAELGMTLEDEPGRVFGRRYDDDAVPDPEMSSGEADALVDYLRLLGPPPRTTPEDAAQAAAGEGHFTQIGCAKCHSPSLEGVPLYSDLLLHQLLPAEAVGIEEASADMWEFRTAPLWGLAKTAPYLHDGRGDTVEQAIAGHAGEAGQSVENWMALSEEERAELLAFLGTL